METLKMMKTNCGERLRVCSDANQGMRKYMEDELSVCIQSKSDDTSFLGVFDGHGGKEAAVYAKEHLYSNIRAQPEFSDSDPEKVRRAIREGFVQTHLEMSRVVDTWPKRKDGLNSTSGTTATVIMLRGDKLYVAHVGDSAAAMSYQDGKEFVGKELTRDHKPEDMNEKARIENLGGRVVVSNNGVHRVVWKRFARNRTHVAMPRYEYVPFLAVSRALGDLWSYDHEIDEFIVSPEPEISVLDYKPGLHKFIILASDGLWGVMNAQEAVKIVSAYENNSVLPPEERNSSQHLLNKSLEMWQKRRSRADNISVIVAFFDDEFGSIDNADRDADTDTDIVSCNEDDTPPINGDCDNVKLVRQIAFREEKIETKLNTNEIPVEVPVEDAQNNSSTISEPSCIRNDEPSCLGKRKNDDVSCDSTQKKVKTLPKSEDGNICNVVTALSSESLCELQLDDELGFADDESEEISKVLDTTSRVEKVDKNIS